MRSFWYVVHTIIGHIDFNIEYLPNFYTQQSLATGFEALSCVGFTNCTGYIDGVLIWIQKPSEEKANSANVGRKNSADQSKFGLNCKSVSDLSGRFLDVSIIHGWASSDCLAFEASDLFKQLENGVLKEELS